MKSFINHLKELRILFIISLLITLVLSVGSFIFFNEIIALFINPFISNLNINNISEGFITKVEVSFIAGIILAIPFYLINISLFIYPGLRKMEKIVVSIFTVVSFILVFASVLYSYKLLIPISMNFLTDINNQTDGVGVILSYRTNIKFLLNLIFAGVLTFQIPLLLEFLMIIKVVKRRDLLRFGRYFVVIIFILSAIITPPDFVSQLMLALPLTILYYLAILIARIFNFGGSDRV